MRIVFEITGGRFSLNIIPYFFRKLGKMMQNLSSAAALIDSLRFNHTVVNLICYRLMSTKII